MPPKKRMKKALMTENMIKAGMGPMPYREKKCVRITEADNGFTVSTYGPKGEQIKVAKSEAEALRHTKELLK